MIMLSIYMMFSLQEKREVLLCDPIRSSINNQPSMQLQILRLKHPSYLISVASYFIPYRMLIQINYKFKSMALFSAMLNTTTYMTLLFVILGFTLPHSYCTLGLLLLLVEANCMNNMIIVFCNSLKNQRHDPLIISIKLYEFIYCS